MPSKENLDGSSCVRPIKRHTPVASNELNLNFFVSSENGLSNILGLFFSIPLFQRDGQVHRATDAQETNSSLPGVGSTNWLETLYLFTFSYRINQFL